MIRYLQNFNLTFFTFDASNPVIPSPILTILGSFRFNLTVIRQEIVSFEVSFEFKVTLYAAKRHITYGNMVTKFLVAPGNKENLQA